MRNARRPRRGRTARGGGAGSYNPTSNAYKYEYPEQPPGKRRRKAAAGGESRTAERKRRKAARRPLFEYKYDIRRTFVHGEFLAYAAVIIAGAIFLLSKNAEVVETKMRIDGLKRQIKTVSEANQDLRVDITKSYNEKEIAEIARTRLNMAPPKEYQVCMIDVPKESYADVTSSGAMPEPEKRVFFEKLKNAVSAPGFGDFGR
ncbi:MAG: septum formation initiator family protein [Clostridiales bacterium]|jgi:cell division protein FtsL|nr:septum formation initiator family protein [Clostridiales bacterium]